MATIGTRTASGAFAFVERGGLSDGQSDEMLREVTQF